MVLVSVREQSCLAIVQNFRIDGLRKYVPLAAVRRAVEPGIGHDFQVPGVNCQAGVTYVFDLHF